MSVKDYFAYAEAGFALRSISNHIFTCTLEVLTSSSPLPQVCKAKCYTPQGNLKVTSTCEDRSAPHFVKV